MDVILVIMGSILLIIGFAILAKCADIFVDGASNIAYNLKIPAIIVGLTIVAFGTSAPEAAMSLLNAHSGHVDTALTTIIGSNIFNILMVIGISTFFGILTIKKDQIKRDFPFLIISTIGLLAIAINIGELSQQCGIIFLIIIFAYVIYLIIKAKQERQGTSEKVEAKLTLNKSLLYTIIGLIGIAFGSILADHSTHVIAEQLELSGGIIGLTLVSIGTSLPELITSVNALRKREKDMVIGNVLGSSIFNILFILGITSAFWPITINEKFIPHIVIMTIITIIGAAFAYTQNEVNKKEGFVLVLLYIAYIAYLSVNPI